jgi:hypothetical protein
MNEARWTGRKHFTLAVDAARCDRAPSLAVGWRCDESPASESRSIAALADGLLSRINRASWHVVIPLLLSATSIGCLSTGSPQVERCQTEKKQLLSRLVDEQKRGESLTTELRTANQRLADAEKQLARVVGGAGANRLASSNDQSYSPRQPPNPYLGNASGFPPGNPSSSPLAYPLASAPNSVQLGAPRDSQFVSTPAKTTASTGGSRVANGPSGGAASGMPGGAASGMAGGVGTVPISSPAPVDSRGFNQLGPQNGRSESGWMPRALSNPASGSSMGAAGIAPTGQPR